MAKTALEKLNIKKEPKIIASLPAGIPWAKEGSSMVVSTPQEVNSILQTIPYKKLVTITQVRNYLAKKHHTNIACPISTGIFINICAAAAKENKLQGIKKITPYWRVLKAEGLLNEKYPNGLLAHKQLLEAEDFIIEQKSKKKFVVQNYQNFLINLGVDT